MCLSCLHAFVPQITTCLRVTCLKLPRPYVLTCLKLLRVYVPMYLKLLRAYVPMCPYFSRGSVPSFFTCLGAYVRLYIFFHAYVPSCLKLFCVYKRSFLTCLRSYNHCQNILRLTSIRCIAVFLWIIWPFIPFKTPKQTPASKTAYLNPILWGFVISTGACTETIIWGLVKKLSKAIDSF